LWYNKFVVADKIDSRGRFLPPGTIIDNRYIVIRLLGSGGFADVYEVEDKILKLRRALKLFNKSIDENLFSYIKREVELGFQIKSENVIAIYHLGIYQNCHYIIMELVDGKSLAKILEEKGRLEPKEVEEVAKQILLGLSYLHKKNLIHRDIKPSNILIDKNGKIKVADLGLLKPEVGMTITEKDIVMGSVEYIAPEILKGKRATKKSDLYSLGITLYELLSGNPPFTGSTPYEVLKMHEKKKIPPIPRDIKAPKKLQNFIILLTKKDPNQRPSDAEEALKILNSNKIKVPKEKKLFLPLILIIILFFFLQRIFYISLEKKDNLLKVKDIFGIKKEEKRFDFDIKEAFVCQADNDLKKEIFVLASEEKEAKKFPHIFIKDKKWEELRWEVPKYFENYEKSYNVLVKILKEPNRKKDLIFFIFHHHPYSPSFINQYCNGKLITIFSSLGHISEDLHLAQIQGDQNPDLIGSSYATSFSGVRAVFSIEGIQWEGNLTFLQATAPNIKADEHSRILFYTLVEPENMDYIRIKDIKNNEINYLKNENTNKFGKIDFFGNLEESPYFNSEEKEIGWVKKRNFYNFYFLLDEKLKNGDFEEGLKILKDSEEDFKEILKEPPLYHIYLLKKSKFLIAEKFERMAVEELEREAKTTKNGEVSFELAEIFYCLNEYAKGDYYLEYLKTGLVFGRNIWNKNYIKVLAEIIKGERDEVEKELDLLKNVIEEAFVKNDIRGLVLFFDGNFEGALDLWKDEGQHLPFVYNFIERIKKDRGEDFNFTYGNWRYLIYDFRNKKEKELFEEFEKLKKFSKFSLEAKLQIPFFSYDFAEYLIKNRNFKKAKEIVQFSKNICKNSYISLKLRELEGL